MADVNIPKGGAFLLEPGKLEACFTPEDMSDEHRMILQTTKDFVVNEIHPLTDKIEDKDEATAKSVLAQAGELGLLGTDVPEEFGGMGLDKMTTCVITDAMGMAGSFAVSFGAHTGIGTLPIVYFGSQAQKEKYLPDLASGQKFAAYGLTEAGAGSDAVGGCRTKAVLSPDGKHWIINGEKMFITNGGWADTIIVFAKIDGVDFSAFIVERGFPGVSSGAEEKKMGIKGSSTTTIILEDAQVPVENLLYERGKGHIIALNVLNIGRYKLGAAAVGGAKGAVKMATSFAKGRVQFGQSIAEFGAIQEKLARMATQCYIGESAIYRTVGLIDAALHGADHSAPDYGDKASAAIRQYAIECAIDKVLGSEVLDFVVDENVQVHGGYGYCAEYPAERCYRDARINRIFEGTNEVNRLLIPGEIMKRAMSGKLPLMAAGQKLLGEIMDYSPLSVELPDEPLALQTHMVEMCKKAVIFVAGVAVQKLMQKLAKEQEVLMRLADMIIQVFAMESGLLRAKKAVASLGAAKAQIYIDMVEAYVDEMIPMIDMWAKQALAYVEDGDTLRTQLVGIRKLLKYTPLNQIALNKRIAAKVIDKGGYPLDI
ncbi:MAG: acyl-CoA dehydrogenase family protein [Desulfarculus sp.]|nr:acyl-CoA dehydrogenase family protein [Desulfarculus sp.]